MMDLNERQWQAGMNFRIDGPELGSPAFAISLADAQSRRREFSTHGIHAVLSRITEAGEAIALHDSS